MLAIRMLRVREGDCLWIDYGSKGEVHRILVDGGPDGAPALRQEIAKELEGGKPLHFDLVVVTHIDTDHIAGIIDLLGNLPPRVTIGEVWFNGYQHLVPADQLGGSNFEGEVRSYLAQPKATPRDQLGAAEGEDLATILTRDYRSIWNKRFPLDNPSEDVRRRAIVVPETGRLPSVPLAGEATLTLLSPRKKELDDLAKAWNDLLGGKGGHGMEDVLAEEQMPKDYLGKKDVWPPDLQALANGPPRKDPSKNNGSSIAFIFTYGEQSILFAADAFSDVLADGIRRHLSDQGMPHARLKLDAFKLSHHGSANNLSNELLELLECPRYLVSTDGTRHRHPDHEALARVLLHGGRKPRLVFNAEVGTTADWNGVRLSAAWPEYDASFPGPGEKERGIDVVLGS